MKVKLLLNSVLLFSALNAENNLVKLEHHKTSEGVHCGTLSLYFSESNVCAKPKEIEGSGVTTFVFTIPGSVTSSELQKKINALNNSSHGSYKVFVKPSNNEIQISFEFDPKKFGLEVQTFKAIKMEKGINFTIIDRNILNRLDSKKDKPVLTTVQVKMPKNIVIDVGHGGKDFGTIGFLGKAEKNVTLDVGLQVAKLLNKNGYCVGLTRDCDQDITLGDRTLFANQRKADLFVSIHANSSPNKSTKGIETYCLDYGLFKPCFSTLNSDFARKVAMIEKERCTQSHKLALCVHKTTLNTVAKKNSNSDRNVRSAASQVLLGTQMPAILIEIGFLSNEFEASLLYDKHYQKLIAQGISDGIISYLDTLKII